MRLEAKKYLFDMKQAASLLAQFTSGKDFADYDSDAMLRAAVERELGRGVSPVSLRAMVDAVARLLPGVLGNEASSAFESFQDGGHGEGLLDCPHWTRPADFRGWKAPDVLLNGNHEEIRRFRKQSAIEKTTRLRRDLLKGYPAGEE